MQFSLDHLTPTEFEELCYDLLESKGFVNLSWRKGTGLNSSPSDQGRDIECERVIKDSLDNSSEIEKWYVECKHHKNGVPPDKLHGALTWALAGRPNRLLIIASNFLSNPSKEFLSNYSTNNAPPFHIKIWERKDLERLLVEDTEIKKKYKIRSHKQHLLDTSQLNDQLYLHSIAATILHAVRSAPKVSIHKVEPFDGSGLYLIHYDGEKDLYPPPHLEMQGTAIYAGKAISSNGLSLKGGSEYYSSALYRRLQAHLRSLQDAVNLNVEDFSVQYAPMADIWATLGAPYLIDEYHPLWNTKIDGFGNHDPGAGRYAAKRSLWDTLHPGRKWADRLSPRELG